MKLSIAVIVSLLIAAPAAAQSDADCNGVPFRLKPYPRNSVMLGVLDQAVGATYARFGEMAGVCRQPGGETVVCGVAVRLGSFGEVTRYTKFHGVYATGQFYLAGSGNASFAFCKRTGLDALLK